MEVVWKGSGIGPGVFSSAVALISKQKEEKDKEIVVPDIEEKFQKILDVNLKIMDNFVSELSEIKRILHRLNPTIMSQSLVSIPFKKEQTDHITPTSNLIEKRKKKKKQVKVDDLQKKRKRKKGSGPPKRLPLLQSKQSNEHKTARDESLTAIKIKEIKASLKPTSQILKDSSVPPSAPTLIKENGINKNSLNPPPPPPQTSGNFTHKSLPKRTEIISELKEMFVKRGLVTQYEL